MYYWTYQRQQSDEHVRFADKVLNVELAADFAGPVGLRTRIHIIATTDDDDILCDLKTVNAETAGFAGGGAADFCATYNTIQ